MQNEDAGDMALADLEAFYREAKKHYDEDEVFTLGARLWASNYRAVMKYRRTMWR